ncbi:MAG: hypothetical protein IT581_08890 [Verrucomicrobiales bacterium]|nr:hypothetical protein [Verrucomicrobiales bacterium]
MSKRLGRVWIWGAVILALVGVLVIVSGGWQRHLRKVYEASLREIRDRGEPISPADLGALFPKVAADWEMDALLLRLFPGLDLEAGRSPVQESQLARTLLDLGGSVAPLTARDLASMEAEVHTNAAAMDALLKVDLAGFSWRRNFGEGEDVLKWTAISRISVRRELCRALAIRAIWEAEQGRCERAVTALERGFQMARIPEPANAVSVCCQLGCEREVLRALELCLNRGQWDESSLRRLDGMLARNPNWVIEEHELTNRATIIAMMALAPPQVVSAVGLPRWAVRWCSLMSHRRSFAVRLRQLRDLTALVTASRLPLREGLVQARVLNTRIQGERNGLLRQLLTQVDADLMVDSLVWGNVAQPFILNFKANCDLQVARAAVAIERWRLAHAGQIPNSWSDLVPAYLSEVPMDPADDQPLRFIKGPGAGYRVYSCGADLVDDGGVSVMQEWRQTSGYDVVLRMER